ncbi:MAG: phosphate signaling complex protein PhoU [Anaerolineales bacterium]|nr:phosphate signaling complex protein PhoU [Anaerolineales bacterium]MCA9931159.1 phosphate signaling complex protein PhoU [Anaerolineales bacterium]
MLRESFTQELRQLQDEILRLGSEVEEHLVVAADAFRKRDMLRSQRMIKADEWINERRLDIMSACLQLIATQQPIAGDMRLIAATMEIVGELERIHDYVKGIGRISLLIGDEPFPDTLASRMPEMAEKTRYMLHRALEAYSRKDATLAKAIPAEDTAVDTLYNQTHKAVIDYIIAHPEKMEKAHRIEWTAHNLERSADRVINICEWVVYVGTGKYEEMS